MDYNNLFITCEQLTNDIEVKTSFLSFFACVIKEPLIISDMATTDMDLGMNGQEQQNRHNRGWYVPQQEGLEAY